jgi:hypothetical protein
MEINQSSVEEIVKILTVILTLLFPLLVTAQNYSGMSEGDMQNMMLQMQKMQTCMQGVDQSRLQEFEQQAKKTEAEIKSLCASGKRDDAQKKAMDFGQEVAGNPDMQKMVECGKMMGSAMPYVGKASESDKSVNHVCDQ